MPLRAYRNPKLACWRMVTCAALLAVAAHGQAQAADLIDHNGFEACWSQAITKPAFLSALNSSIEGTTGCITAIPGNPTNICEISTCTAANVHGCPITLHAGVFSGDFVSGSFDGPGSVDDFSTSVTSQGITCLATITNMTLAYAPTYSLQMDGNNGVYTAALNDPVPVTIPNQAAVSISGGFGCDALASGFAAVVLRELGKAVSNAVAAALPPATVGESICPLSP